MPEETFQKVYRDADVDMSILDGKTVAVIGYGIQGRPQSLNMRDSGVKVNVLETLARPIEYP